MVEIKWIKICTDIFDDEKMLLIDAMPDRDAILVVWLKLLCLAGKQNNDGVFLMNDKVPYTDEMLAAIFRRPLMTVRLALKTFEELGMIQILDDVITIPNWEKYQNTDQMRRIREANRIRKANERARKRLAAGNGPSEMESRQNQVYEYATQHPDATRSEISRALGIPRTTVIRYLSSTPKENALPPTEGEYTDAVSEDCPDGHVHLDTVDMSTPVHSPLLDMSTDSDMDTSDSVPHSEKPQVDTADAGVHDASRVTHASVTPLDVDEDIDTSSSTSDDEKSLIPSLSEVVDFFEREQFDIDPRYFFTYNARRGWITKSGKPIDDWKQLARTWNRHEVKRAAPARRPAEKNSTPVPTVEEIMERYGVDKAMAARMIEEDLY